MHRLLRRAAFWLRRERHAADLAAEIEEHRARRQAALEAGGVPAAEAARRSRRDMGNVTLAREDARDAWSFVAIERAWRDAVYGVRALRREPAFAFAALVTLTLGCVTTIAVFSVANAELWRPLPFADPQQLVAVRSMRTGPGSYSDRIAPPDLADWRAQSRLGEYAGIEATSRRVLRLERAEAVTVRGVTANFFHMLRLPPSLGRGFTVEDADGPCAALLSDGGWRRLFDADRAVVGRTIRLGDEPCTIAGVLAGARLEFTSEPDLFVAIAANAPGQRDRLARTLDVYGRLGPGIETGQALAELQTIAARIAEAFPDDHAGRRIELRDLKLWSTGFNWRELYFFMGAAALVMVLAGLNVANLLLSRALRRRREFAIRGALGGGRHALVRQLIVEGAVLAVPAAAAGTVISMWVLRVFTSRIPESYLERGGHLEIDARVAAFVLALSAVTTLLLALAPLLFARRVELNMMLGHGGRLAGGSPRHRRARTLLVVGQVTATVVLLTAAGLLGISFVRLRHAPLGFEPDGRLALRVALPAARYADDASIRAFADRLLAQAKATPGVREAAVGSGSPLDDRGGPAVQIAVPDRPRPAKGQEPTAVIRSASPGYFSALGIMRVAGREFTEDDSAGAPRVAVVNELLARRMFPGEPAIGRQLEIVPRLRTGWTHRPGLVTIVGVVNDVKNFGINEVQFNNVFLPFAQAPAPGAELIVRAASSPASVADAVRRAAGSVDPSVPIALGSLTDRADLALKGDRFNLTLIAFLAGVAVLLAAVGIYGSMSCSIQERLREFGVRVALGAAPRTILGGALGESARVALTGTVLGAALALLIARLIGNALYLVPQQHGGILYGVTTTNPLALGGACVAVIAVATLSGLGPARRATRVDPIVVLREE